MSRQWRSDDTVKWKYGFGTGKYDATIGTETVSWNGSTRFQAQGSITGTAGNTSFTKPSGWGHKGLCLLIQTQGTGVGKWELAYVDFSGASAVADKPLQNSYTTGAQIVTLSNGNDGYKNVNITGTLSASTWNGATGGIIAILASKSITVSGSISVASRGYNRSGNGGASGSSDNDVKSLQGEGSPGTGTYLHAANGSGGGGSSGSGADGGNGGGGGGHANAGTNGQPGQGSSGIGGVAVGTAQLTTMFFGGEGGGGRGEKNGSGTGGYGGNSGGIVILIAPTITISGTIILNGANGTNGSGSAGGGGGGAGGSCLIKCVDGVFGTNKITSTGGSGGICGGGDGGNGNGGAGSVGRIHVDYSKSISGSTNPTISSRLDKTIRPVTRGGAFLLSEFT